MTQATLERANRVGLLHQGRLIRCDTPEVLKGPLPSLEAAFIATIQEAGRMPYRDWER